MTGISKETKQIVDDPKSKEEGRERMVTQVIHGLMAPMLSPGKIGDIADVQLRHFTDFLNAIPNGHEAELFRFLSREITRASMVTFYGPNNPFALHPELVEEFWNWEGGIVGYMMGIFPKWTARKAHHGLENCVKAFIEYMQHNRHSQAYELLRRRQQFHQDEGITLEEQARLEIPMCLGINVNAGITVLWMMNHIFSRPALLAEVREEVQSNALVKPDLISFTALRDKCPLINSIYKESMRIAAPMTSGRYVVADTLVADTWLLRKGTVVQIAGPALHTNKEIWGADAETFNPRRFVYNWNGTRSSEDGSIVDGKANQVPSAAYRSFGGGSSLCPGRHFAQMEIVSLAALLVMGFDLEAPSGQDRVCWNPPMDDKRFPIAVIKPLKDLNVKFTRRSGTEDVQWKLEY
jgi:cytochrome P450